MQGESSSSISEKLYISVHTVNTPKAEYLSKAVGAKRKRIDKIRSDKFKTEYSYKSKN
jgi:DNA-binding NarL/FixJ family response regulator